MKFTIPNLLGSDCVRFTACGYVSGPTDDQMQWSKVNHNWTVGKQGGHESAIYVRVGLTDNSSKGCHVHVDIYREEAFSRKPPVADSVTDFDFLDKLLIPFQGAELDITLTAGYAIDPTNEPFILKSLRQLSYNDDNNFSIALKDVTFRIEGVPLKTVSWSIEPDGKATSVLKAETKMIIDPNYLTSGFNHVNSVYELLLKGTR